MSGGRPTHTPNSFEMREEYQWTLPVVRVSLVTFDVRWHLATPLAYNAHSTERGSCPNIILCRCSRSSVSLRRNHVPSKPVVQISRSSVSLFLGREDKFDVLRWFRRVSTPLPDRFRSPQPYRPPNAKALLVKQSRCGHGHSSHFIEADWYPICRGARRSSSIASSIGAF